MLTSRVLKGFHMPRGSCVPFAVAALSGQPLCKVYPLAGRVTTDLKHGMCDEEVEALLIRMNIRFIRMKCSGQKAKQVCRNGLKALLIVYWRGLLHALAAWDFTLHDYNGLCFAPAHPHANKRVLYYWEIR